MVQRNTFRGFDLPDGMNYVWSDGVCFRASTHRPIFDETGDPFPIGFDCESETDVKVSVMVRFSMPVELGGFDFTTNTTL